MKPFSLLRRIATIALLMAASSAHADTFPSRPIRLIVPFGPGGITDLIARQAALGMAEKLGQPVIIENKPSAGHIVAMQTVAQATPDGYTILLGSNTGFTVAPHMYKNLPFRIDTLQPIAPINTAPTVLLARPDFPANNPTELIQYIKDNPGKLNYGSFRHRHQRASGHGDHEERPGPEHHAHPLPRRCAGPAGPEGQGSGHRLYHAVLGPGAHPGRRIQGAGRAAERPPHRLSRHPDHRRSRLEELGHAGLIAFFAPPGTPDAVMRKLESATRSASSAPAFVEFLHNNGVEPWNPSNQDLMRFIQDQLNRSGPIIQEIGLQPQ